MKRKTIVPLFLCLLLFLSACSRPANAAADGNLAIAGTEASGSSGKEANKDIENMTKMLGAIMLTAYQSGLEYDPSDPEMYWNGLYYYFLSYGQAIPGTVYDSSGEYFLIKAPALTEAQNVMFGDAVTIPALPASMKKIQLLQDGSCRIEAGKAPEAESSITDLSENKDGTWEAVSSLTDASGAQLYSNTYHLKPRTGKTGVLDMQYQYAVCSGGMG